MTWLWIILSIIAFFVILLILPVRVFYVGGTNEQDVLKIKYLFFSYTAMPKKEKKPSRRKERKKLKKAQKKAEKEQKSGPAPEQTLSDKIELAKTAVRAVDGTLKKFMRRLRVKLALSITIGRDNAADTAVDYGKYNSYIYSAYATLSNAVRFKKTDITVDPDFEREIFEYKISCKLTASLFIIVSSALSIALRFVKLTAQKKQSDEKDGTVKKEQASPATAKNVQ